MYDNVFSKACELGREQELFGLTKEQKEFYDTAEAYHRTKDESKILGDDANIAPEDFFCKLRKTFYNFLLQNVHFYILFPII